MNEISTVLPSTEGRAHKRTAIETVHIALRESIMNGELKSGERLHVDNLRKEFGVSTSTMREALSRLLIDSLVTSENQRGFRVTPLSLQDFRNITDARKVIETTALRASMGRRDDAWESNLVSAYHSLTLVEQKFIEQGKTEFAPQWNERNAHFHDCLVANCENTWLIRFRKTLHHQSHRYHRVALAMKLTHRDSRIEHKAIFEAAMANDIERCVRELGDHIEATVATMAPNLSFD